jgi:D-inositol-3-phosphate glycosyltransferase
MLSIHSSPLGPLGTEDTGGMSVYLRELSRELGKVGHRVDIYTCAESQVRSTDLYLSERVRLIRLTPDNSRDMTKHTLFGRLPDVFRSLQRYSARNSPSYDLIHSHYWLSGWIGRLAQNLWEIPHAITFHTTGMAKRVACAAEREPLHRLTGEKLLARTSDRIIVSSDREGELIRKHCGVAHGKIGIVPCGVDLRRFHPVEQNRARRETGLADARSVILYVGRFAPVKGLERLVAAASHLRRHRGLKLVIIGGDERETSAGLRRLVKSAGLTDIVTFLGRIEHDLLPLYYSAADVLVLPSYYESFGLVAIEALACGTPVVATRVGAMVSVISGQAAGLVVDDGSPRSLASAIERFLVPVAKGQRREEVRASVLGYSWAHSASALLREYAHVLRSSP